MPTSPRTRCSSPVNWSEISDHVRFVRAKGRCEQCARPHGSKIRCLPDGRWFDTEASLWRDGHGLPASWPDVVDYAQHRNTRICLSACCKDPDLEDDTPANLLALCQRCRMLHSRVEHQRRSRVTILMRRAMGDLFEGAYSY